MSIDPSSAEPVYVQVARVLREEIIRGDLPLGTQTPSEKAVASRFGISRPTSQQVFRLLRDEGLIVTRKGHGSFVAAVPQVRTVTLLPGDTVRARMPDEEERARLILPPGIPVLVVTHRDGRTDVYGAAAVICRCEDEDASLMPA